MHIYLPDGKKSSESCGRRSLPHSSHRSPGAASSYSRLARPLTGVPAPPCAPFPDAPDSAAARQTRQELSVLQSGSACLTVVHPHTQFNSHVQSCLEWLLSAVSHRVPPPHSHTTPHAHVGAPAAGRTPRSPGAERDSERISVPHTGQTTHPNAHLPPTSPPHINEYAWVV